MTHQPRSYIPKTDWGKRSWFNNFVAVASAHAEALDLAPEDIAYLEALAQRYDEAFEVVMVPEQCTAPAVRAKNDARARALRVFRRYAMRIKQIPSVDVDLREALGLHVDKRTKTPIGPPRTAPVLKVLPIIGGHRVYYADRKTPTSRAKPPGVEHLELHVAVGERAAGLDEARLVGLYSRCPFVVTFPEKEGGLTATYYARWVTRRGLYGPWSAGVCMQIAHAARPTDDELQRAA